LSDEADVVYKCTDYYHPASEYGIAWDDPDLGIEWPVDDKVLSAKDIGNPRLRNQSNLPVYQP
jgi:dTDP-4-dehydrorhamnose 3,5-epimerase